MNSNGKKADGSKKTETEKDPEFTARIRGPPLENRKKYLKWSQEENKMYLDFLRASIDEHDSLQGRRPTGYFAKMAIFLGNGRTKEQCRSHHQKYLLKYKFVEKIIEILEECEGKRQEQSLQKDKQSTGAGIKDEFPVRKTRKQSVTTQIQMKMIDDEDAKPQEKDGIFNFKENDILHTLLY